MKKIKVLNKFLVEIWQFLSIILHTTTKIIMQMLIDKFQIHNLQLKRNNFVQKKWRSFLNRQFKLLAL